MNFEEILYANQALSALSECKDILNSAAYIIKFSMAMPSMGSLRNNVSDDQKTNIGKFKIWRHDRVILFHPRTNDEEEWIDKFYIEFDRSLHLSTFGIQKIFYLFSLPRITVHMQYVSLIYGRRYRFRYFRPLIQIYVPWSK